MRIRPECIPCSLRQIITTASRITQDEAVHHQLMRQGLHYMQETRARTPAEITTGLFHLVAKALATADPYGPEKRHYNREAMALYPRLRPLITGSADPLRTAVLLAVAGNLLDLGILAPMAVDEVVDGVLAKGLARETLAELRRDLGRARALLYVADNAGEIAFDRLLMEEIQREFPGIEVAVAVKSGPAMNDALREDAEEVRLPEIARVIETGAACLGVPRAYSSPAFLAALQAADIVIAKGHANYETLDEEDHPALYFLLTTKCESVARAIGAGVGESVMVRALGSAQAGS